MAENRGHLPSGVKITFVDTTKPLQPVNVAPTLVPVDQAAPGPPIQAPEDVAGPSGVNRHEPLDLNLLDEVDEGVQRLNVVPPSPKSRRLQELEEMVLRQSNKHRETVKEAQAIIDRANNETLAMQRERDGALARAAPRQAPLSALPVPFEFGGFHSTPPPRTFPAPVPPPRHPSPLLSPPLGLAPWLEREEEMETGGET